MSGYPVLIGLGSASGTGGSFPVALKKLMETPPPHMLDGDDDTDKVKLCLGDDADQGGGGGDVGASAALTPAIWEKTIPYDGENFHLEYMDLEEFLMENGVPNFSDEDTQRDGPEGSATETKNLEVTKATGVGSLLPLQTLDCCKEEAAVLAKSDADVAEVTTDTRPAVPEPIGPEEVEVDVDYEPDPTDLVLSSVPGGALFDPRKHKFTEDELKPQPMIKKAKKVFVPEGQKDEKYWRRRNKNNVAAKRSREARRLKENQIGVRAAFLERENAALRAEVAELRTECDRSRKVVGHYEATFGPL
ncbi:thyrotroph embryonic factor-like isoform X2 [Brachionichthys hirsutus]|uniref:thyrotroph embryonic factor-like isoform X2 n=1 Tax=Brachionichthys hirsutus TaxID=412623 RepID=UPI003604C0A4